MKQLVLSKQDYEQIAGYIKLALHNNTCTIDEAAELQQEMKNASIVEKQQLPADVVCLNSKIVVRDETNKKVMEVTLVGPEKADIRQKKISVMSPVGTALIGFKKGQVVSWNVPAGRKKFKILDVINE